MSIPERFQMRPAPDDLILRMSELCDQIEHGLETNDDVESLLAEWHNHASRVCEPGEFTSYWKSIDKESFVREALNPQAEYVADLKYDEARAVLASVTSAKLSESDTHFYLAWLKAQFPLSNISDLIYWPDVWFGDASLFGDEGGAFKPEAELSLDQMLFYAMAKSSRELADQPAGIELPFPLPQGK